MKSSRRLLQIGVGGAVSALLLYVVVRGQDWDKIGAALADAHYSYIPAIVGVSLYSLVVRAQRWKALVERALARSQALAPVFSATAIGFMSNLVLPLRAGEVVRPYLLTRFSDVPVSTAFATAVLERVLDMIAILVLLMAVALSSGFEEPIKSIAVYASAMAAVALVAIFVVHREKDRYLPKLDRLWQRFPDGIARRLIVLEHGFFDGLASIAETRVLVPLILWSLYLWMVIALTFYLGTLAIDIHVGYVGGGLAVATVLALWVAVPSAPGFVGVWQAGCMTALALYGVDAGRALAFSFFSQAMVVLSQLPIGLVYLVREGLSFGELGRARAEAAEASAGE